MDKFVCHIIMKKSVDIVIVLDRSGSMASIKDDAEGGFNSFIKEQKEQEGNVKVTLVQFDNEYEIVYERKNIDEVESLNIKPRNTTALLDAVGNTINILSQRLDELDEKEKPEGVIFVIITDGHENSSKEFVNNQIKDLINKKENEEKWEFVFIGADKESFDDAKNIGIKHASTMTYSADSIGVKYAFDTLSKGTSSYRESKEKYGFFNFSDNDDSK